MCRNVEFHWIFSKECEITDSLTLLCPGRTCYRLKNPKVFGYAREQVEAAWAPHNTYALVLAANQPSLYHHRSFVVVVIQGGTDAPRLRCILKPKASLRAQSAGQPLENLFSRATFEFSCPCKRQQIVLTKCKHVFYGPAFARSLCSRNTVYSTITDLVSVFIIEINRTVCVANQITILQSKINSEISGNTPKNWLVLSCSWQYPIQTYGAQKNEGFYCYWSSQRPKLIF